MSEATNGIDAEVAKRWVGEIERLDEEILSIKMRNAAEQKVVKERRKACFERAEAAGLPTGALKLEIFKRDLDRKLAERQADAGKETVDLAEQIRQALGDFGGLPLGGAAIEAAERLIHSDGTVVVMPPKRGRERPRKDAVAPVTAAAGAVSGAAALDSLINPVEAPGDAASDDHADVRPAFLRRADEEAAAANEAALANLKALN